MATPTDKKQRHILTIRVPRELHDKVRLIAERESETDSTVVRRLIRRGLEREPIATTEATR
jgi:predicted DNA-binding protein